MVATGMSYKQIATRLVLSHRTVQNHVQNTLGKLQLHNRVELVRYAIEHGLAGEFTAGEPAELPSGRGGRRPGVRLVRRGSPRTSLGAHRLGKVTEPLHIEDRGNGLR